MAQKAERVGSALLSKVCGTSRVALYSLGNGRLESSSGKGSRGSWSVARSLNQQCPGARREICVLGGIREARPGRGLPCSALGCRISTLSAMGSFGHSNARKIQSCWKCSKDGHKDGEGSRGAT